MNTLSFDVVILGAGGAGMMCALHAGRRGLSVALIDHAKKPGGKISISGGGRCNFTNLGTTDANYVSQNPHFVKSALSRYKPEDFLALIRENQIAFHERKHRQLFCDQSASQIVDMLVKLCNEAKVTFFLETPFGEIVKKDGKYYISTPSAQFTCQSLVVATGGLSIPKIGATGIGFEIAKQFGHRIVPTAPALDGFVLSQRDAALFGDFAGIAIEVEMSCGKIRFQENLLFTHVGLSGPVSLQTSLHWNSGDIVSINFLPQFTHDQLFDWFATRKSSKADLKNMMAELLPRRLAERLIELSWPQGVLLANIKHSDLERFCEDLRKWRFVPQSTVGYSKAEVTRGGVDTSELSSKTMESNLEAGLYFIGEVVDVAGWLGGFNYQWAWASGAAAGSAVRGNYDRSA